MSSCQKILLVEDDKYIALALKIRLEAEGFDVHSVPNSKQALCSASERFSDIALIDYNLPDGNGIELMEQILQLSGERAVIPIIMTASKRPGLRERALSQGAFQFFEKPFKSADLIQSIKSFNLG